MQAESKDLTGMQNLSGLSSQAQGMLDVRRRLLIVVACQDTARYSFFTECLANLRRPHGSQVYMPRSVNIAFNLNRAVDLMLKGDFTHLFQMGDDHGFTIDFLERLLAWDVDAVAGLVSNRQPPFGILAWSHRDSNGDLVGANEIPDTGLMKVAACGSAGMLLTRKVVETLKEKHERVFENTSGLKADEDMNLCARINAAGFDLFVDCGLRLGHIGMFIASPRLENGKWGVEINMGDGVVLFLPLSKIVEVHRPVQTTDHV
jgi:hypothetical protein